MSLLNFGFKRKANEDRPEEMAKKTAVNVTSRAVIVQRKRDFQEKWKAGRPWLVYNTETKCMTCSYCSKVEYGVRNAVNSFIVGCYSLRIDSIKKHEISELHKKNQASYLASLQEPGTSVIEKSLQNMEAKHLEQMKKLFNATLYLSLKERPFRDFPDLIKLLIKNGNAMGESYASDKQARVFTYFIAEDLRSKLVQLIKSNSFISVLSDSSTDSSITEQEIIYIRLLDNGKAMTTFLSLKPLEKADSPGIFKSIVNALEEDGGCLNWKDKLVGFAADGAPVMMGQNNGVAALFKNEVPNVLGIHCLAHRLELTIKDAMKNVSCMKTLDLYLSNLYKLYHYSPLNWTGLKEAGISINVKIKRPTNVSGTRWIEHRNRATSVMLHNFKALVMHTSQVALGKTSTSDKAKGIHDVLINVKFVLFAILISDFFFYMSNLSKMLQGNDITLDEVLRKVKAAKIKVMNDVATLEDKLEVALKEHFSEDGMIYQNQKLKLDKGKTFQQIKQFIVKEVKEVLDTSLKCLDIRFDSFMNNDIITAAKVFQPKNWPDENLQNYGNEEIKSLAIYFQPQLEKNNFSITECPLEWIELKLHITHLLKNDPKLNFFRLYQKLFQQNDFINILALANIIFVLPFQTAECERGFSLMSSIKTDWRSLLKPSILCDLLRIKLSDLTIDSFDASSSIARWWSSGKQMKRPHTAPYGKHKDHHHDSSDSCSDSEII